MYEYDMKDNTNNNIKWKVVYFTISLFVQLNCKNSPISCIDVFEYRVYYPVSVLRWMSRASGLYAGDVELARANQWLLTV